MLPIVDSSWGCHLHSLIWLRQAIQSPNISYRNYAARYTGSDLLGKKNEPQNNPSSNFLGAHSGTVAKTGEHAD